jgi:hypothetical protein
MTGGALCDADLCELRRMKIQVARFAPWRFRFEICDAKASSRIQCFMALCARRLVGTEQGKCSLRMVEARKIFPCLGGVATLTPLWLSIRSCPQEHVESPLMRIRMARRAANACPVILRGRFRFEICRRLMTVAARNRQMTPA